MEKRQNTQNGVARSSLQKSENRLNLGGQVFVGEHCAHGISSGAGSEQNGGGRSGRCGDGSEIARTGGKNRVEAADRPDSWWREVGGSAPGVEKNDKERVTGQNLLDCSPMQRIGKQHARIGGSEEPRKLVGI